MTTKEGPSILRWIAFLLLPAVLLLAIACGDEEEVSLATSTPLPQDAARAENTPTVSPAASPITTAASEADPLDFREFGSLVARAAAERDTAFFNDRVEGEPYTCTESDVDGLDLPIAEPGLCQEVGQQLDLVCVGFYRSEFSCGHAERLVTRIEEYFAEVLPAEEDEFGTGDIRLYAIALTREPEPLNTAILTAITSPFGERARTVRGIDFEYVEGRWVIRSMLVANVLAGELLIPETPHYSDWAPY